MHRCILLVLALGAPLAIDAPAVAGVPDEVIVIMRGDANSSGVVDVADASMISNWLYNGGQEPPCLNQADANDDGQVTIADVSYLTNWLYQGGPPPPAPGPFGTVCTVDAAPRPGCNSPPSC